MSFLFRMLGLAKFQPLDVVGYQERFLDGSEAHALIDVRTPQEFQGGHIAHSVNIPLDELGKRMNEIPADKPVVVVCASGSRSSMAAYQIAADGREDVYNLSGGIMAWMGHKKPIKTGKK